MTAGLTDTDSIAKVIRYLSHCWVGSTHDFTMLKEDFPSEKGWFKGKSVRLDLGYLGFDKIYECLEAVLPEKRKKDKI